MCLDHYVEKHAFSSRPQAPTPLQVPRDKKAALLRTREEDCRSSRKLSTVVSGPLVSQALKT